MKKYVLRLLSWIGFALKSLFKCRSKSCDNHETDHLHVEIGDANVLIILNDEREGDE